MNVFSSVYSNISKQIFDSNSVTGSASGDVPLEPLDVILLMMAGESNSRGFAANTELLPGELVVRTIELIGDESPTAFVALDVGTNNSSVDFATRHGLEVSIANLYEDGQFGPYDCKLVKCGQGGARIAQWNVGGSFWNTMLARKNAAETEVAGLNYRWKLFWHQGINDGLDSLPVATWKAATIAHFAALRTLIPGLEIAFPSFPSSFAASYPSYAAAHEEICDEDPLTYYVDATDAGLNDANHFNAAGYKTIGPRLLAALFGHDNNLKRLGPVISLQPLDNNVAEGADATFTVNAESIGSISYAWQRSDDGTNYSTVSGTTNTKIVGPLTVADDDGDKYRARVSSLGYTRESRAANLTVELPPSFDPSVDWAATLVGWWRWDAGTFQGVDGSTATAAANGDPVGTWASKTGSKYFYVPTNPAIRPTLSAADKGILWPNTNIQSGMYLDSSASIKCMIVIAKYAAATIDWSFPVLIGAYSGNTPDLIGGSSGGTTFLGSPFITAPWTYYYNKIASPGGQMPLNTVAFMHIQSNTALLDRVQLGTQSPTTNGRNWKGPISEIVLLSEVPTVGELEDYFATNQVEYGY